MNTNELIKELKEALEPPSSFDESWSRDLIICSIKRLQKQHAEINKLQETAKFLLEQLQEKDLELDEANQRYWNNK